jgi:hypothetical protein
MTGQHLIGERLPYARAPRRVQDRISARLGSEVVEAVDCAGGMSPGPAARLRTRSGRRAFIKACGPELNPDTPRLLRLEAAVLGELPAHPALPRLLDVIDDGDWVVLLVEDLEGTLPRLPWRPHDLEQVSATLSELRSALQGIRPPGVRSARDSSPLLRDRWRELEGLLNRLYRGDGGDGGDGIDPVDPWWREHHDELAGHASRALDVATGDVLAHWDIRADNIMLTGDRTVLVDWGQARFAAPHVDHALLALDCSMSGSTVSTAEFARTDPVLRDQDPADLVALAAACAMAFLARSLAPPQHGLAGLGTATARWAANLQTYLHDALPTL